MTHPDPAIAVTSPLRIGRIALTVRDLATVGSFYERVLGLHRLTGDAEAATFGTPDDTLLELRRDAHVRFRSPREAGLFHTAFLLPTRADLGRWTRHAVGNRVPIQGASDHGVSEALYLADPEGNGIEIYADRPRSAWTYRDGALVMGTEALDLDDLMGSAGAAQWAGFPAGGTVGHVHLQVGAIAPAEAFYGQALGFDLTCRYPGGSFFGSGGYHHHVAANIWNSRNAGARQEPATGLADVGLVARDAAVLAATAARLETAGVAVAHQSGALSFADPWNIPITLTTGH